MKLDERDFLIKLYIRGKKPREVINEEDFRLHHKRAWHLLSKWTDKGWYEYGVSLDLGWLTPEGKAEAQKQILEENNNANIS